MQKRAGMALVPLILMIWGGDALGQPCAQYTEVLPFCAGYTFFGCCTEDGKVRWCQSGATCEINCAAGPPDLQKCGWSQEAGFFDCGPAADPEPSCLAPYSCIKGGCLPTAEAGCCNCPCEDKVCAIDPHCCAQQWDIACVQACAELDGCGSQTGCEKSSTPGCGGCSCELCVCAKKASCCMSAWDSTCGDLCKTQCGGTCGCMPSCFGKECGPDGCGGLCGTCQGGLACDAVGHCGCKPTCDGKECGSDGCGGVCGTCPPGVQCSADGHCGCAPSCVGKDCGPDGCGGVCGACDPGYACKDGHCKCVPDCIAKECGNDGCGGVCDVCPAGWKCTNFHCAPGCTASCAGKECGDDECGGTCGECAAGFACVEFKCLPAVDDVGPGDVAADMGKDGAAEGGDSDPAAVYETFTKDPDAAVAGEGGADSGGTQGNGDAAEGGASGPGDDAEGWDPGTGTNDVADVLAGGDLLPDGQGGCPAGMKLVYGKCVLAKDEVPGTASQSSGNGGGGCNAGQRGAGVGWMGLFLALLGIAKATRDPSLLGRRPGPSAKI